MFILFIFLLFFREVFLKMKNCIKNEIDVQVQEQGDNTRTEKINFLLEFFDQVFIILERDWTNLSKLLINVIQIKKYIIRINNN